MVGQNTVTTKKEKHRSLYDYKYEAFKMAVRKPLFARLCLPNRENASKAASRLRRIFRSISPVPSSGPPCE